MDGKEYEFTNYYYHCGTEWEDGECDSMHNDHCPVCDKEIEPYKSMENATGQEVHHADLDKLKLKEYSDPEAMLRIKNYAVQNALKEQGKKKEHTCPEMLAEARKEAALAELRYSILLIESGKTETAILNVESAQQFLCDMHPGARKMLGSR